jgi:uncharacterized membrane protein YagU involved in acid resistance
MNWFDAVLWGFLATVVLSTVLAISQGLGLSRMSLPFMLGTIVTSNRDRAMVLGLIIHMINGLLFALIYAAAFESLGRATWWLGALMGTAHAVFVLTVGMSLLPGLHPRMVSEYFGPTPNRALQPPGFLALNYGQRTPIVSWIGHVVYGTILGAFYRI